ncbi:MULTISPECIES: formate--tetrahydrofolate ligase [unclassified Spiroplasma]|uniref:formate--tetrahydrofolate ligase n=1 Tax=unclassified Spiroplasma TaxID=2637901 RepID=UPI00313F1C0D
MKNIKLVANDLGIKDDDLIVYGSAMAKIKFQNINQPRKGKLILFTSTNPTPSGEGKTTMSIGLAQGLKQLNQSVCLALREPSLGPVFGIKGGAIGGGLSIIQPKDNINLHFTGDFHAITTANNLVSAIIDNYIFQGNSLDIDINNIIWKRCLDLNDRSLRNVEVTISKTIKRKEQFQITTASDIMAIMALAKDFEDLKVRLKRTVVAYSNTGKEITIADLQIVGSILAILKDALNPNLVQSLEGVPALIHCGPFANIAHGCNSVIATDLALKLSDFVITEAGFGADLGLEKFMNIKARKTDIIPDIVVIVSTIKALKLHGITDSNNPNELERLQTGIANLSRHINIVKTFNRKLVVCINRWPDDSDEEIAMLLQWCESQNIPVAISTAVKDGGAGAIALAKVVLEQLNKPEQQYLPIYDSNYSLREKILTVVQKIYQGNNVIYTSQAEEKLQQLENSSYAQLPICFAKTPVSLTDNPKILGAPKNFDITVRNLKVNSGAGFIIISTGDIITMPGLSKSPQAYNIDVVNNEIINMN